jgi:hypothetical protein
VSSLQHVDFAKKNFFMSWRMECCAEDRGELHDPAKDMAALPRDQVDHRNHHDNRIRGCDRLLDHAGISIAGRAPANWVMHAPFCAKRSPDNGKDSRNQYCGPGRSALGGG